MLAWKSLGSGEEKKQRKLSTSVQRLPISFETLLLAARLKDYGIHITMDMKDLLNLNPKVVWEWQVIMNAISPDDVRRLPVHPVVSVQADVKGLT